MKHQQTGGERKIKAEVMDDGWTEQRQDSSSQEVKSVAEPLTRDSRGGWGGVHRPDRREDVLSVNSSAPYKKGR